MASIITSKARINAAKQYLEQFQNSSEKNMYMFIGKSDPWTSDISPETTVDSVKENSKRWHDMLSLKKIQESNVTHVIPRSDWDATGDTIYVEYSDEDFDIFDHPTTAEVQAASLAGTYTAGAVYVYTDEANVYLCISNNNGIKSVNKPTGRNTSIITTADGYRWKYLYTVSSAETLKYVTPEFIPVKYLTSDDGSNQWLVQDAAIDGAIEHIKVLAGGTGYTNVLSAQTLVSGTTSTGVLPGGASAVNSAYVGCMVFVDSGAAAGQYREITAYDGTTKTFTVSEVFSTTLNGTSIVTIVPKITISGDGINAVAKPIVDAGIITSVSIVAVGEDYRLATATVSGGGGSNASLKVQISPLGGLGKNPVEQLGGYFTMANVRLEYSEDDFPSANDYRRIGIVKNIKNSSDSEIATAATRSATKILSLVSVSGVFSTDEEILSNGTGAPKAKMVEYGSTGSGTGTLKYFNNESTGFRVFAPGEQITGVTSGATALISSITNREILLFEGEIIYVENRRPVMRSVDLVEDIKIGIEH